MVLVFGCLIIATYNGWCPTAVYAYMLLLYIITIATLVSSCLWVIKQLPNMTTTKDKIVTKLLPALLLVLLSLFGGVLLNGISCLQHWRFGFPESHSYLFGFFYFLVFEGLPCSALLYVLRRPQPTNVTTTHIGASAYGGRYTGGAGSGYAFSGANNIYPPTSTRARLDYGTAEGGEDSSLGRTGAAASGRTGEGRGNQGAINTTSRSRGGEGVGVEMKSSETDSLL
jgi:hypothetical protein